VFGAGVASEQQADKALVRLQDDEALCNGDEDNGRDQGKPTPGKGVAVFIESGVGEPRANRDQDQADRYHDISADGP
jgi:hypothetical protein